MPETLFPIRGEVQGGVIKAGRFAPAGTGAITYPTTVHPGYNVARVGVGLFDITFTDRRYPHVNSFVCGLQANAVAASSVQMVSYTAPTATANAVVRVRLEVAGAEADLAANANNQVHFIAEVAEAEKLIG